MNLGNGLIHKSNITLLKQSFMDYVRHGQGRKWLPKTGWASSNVARRCRDLAAPSILPKTGWAIAHLSLTPLMLKYRAALWSLLKLTALVFYQCLT